MLRTRQTPAVPDPPIRWIGADPTLHLARTQVAEAALTDLSVLLLGEPGTGRGLAARTLHARSARHDRPLVHVRCAALSEDQAYGLLFATAPPGALLQAHGGTLFLDAPEALPLPCSSSSCATRRGSRPATAPPRAGSLPYRPT